MNLKLAALALLAAATLANAQATSPTVSPSVSEATRTAVRQLIGDILLNGQAYEYDRQIADTIGPRLTGSNNYRRAADWAQQHFKELGLSNVHTEDWTIPATWEPESATGHILSPVDHPLHIYSVGWSPSTPKHGIEAPVVYIPALTPGVLDGLSGRIKGSIALMDDKTFGEKPSLEQIFTGIDHLRQLGPVAIFDRGGPNGTETLTSFNFSGAIDSIPEAQIGSEDVSLLKRLLNADSDHPTPLSSFAVPGSPASASARRAGEGGGSASPGTTAEPQPVRVQLTLENRIRKDVRVPNVIAEIPGRDLPDEVVVVGAHMDSWQAGTGAQDNGTGVATVLEAARAIKALPQPPRRTIRFILFGGEEEGLLGSTAYVRAHTSDLPHIGVVLISDTGAQPAKGWYLMGRDDEKSALRNISPLLTGLGSGGTSDNTEFLFETDHAAFDVLGVPTLVLWNDTDLYFKLHHKASDTFDSVVQKDLNQGAATTAVTAYAIANSEAPFAPHLNPTEVQSFLKKADKLDEYNYLKKVNSLP